MKQENGGWGKDEAPLPYPAALHLKRSFAPKRSEGGGLGICNPTPLAAGFIWSKAIETLRVYVYVCFLSLSPVR